MNAWLFVFSFLFGFFFCLASHQAWIGSKIENGWFIHKGKKYKIREDKKYNENNKVKGL